MRIKYNFPYQILLMMFENLMIYILHVLSMDIIKIPISKNLKIYLKKVNYFKREIQKGIYI